MRNSRPRIYYLHPLLAGPIRTWPRHFERCAALGFDHILVAPIFLPGRTGNIFTVGDHDRCHPILDWNGDADAALTEIAARCRNAGLTLLLDLVLHRVANHADVARTHQDWFSTALDDDAPPDPRQPRDDRFAALARPEALTHDTGLLGWWRERLRRWLDTGIVGFRCDAPGKIPPAALRKLIESARQHEPEASFIAWTPGTPHQALAGLSGCSFDHTVSSMPWWDFRSEWLSDEEVRLQAIAPPLGLAEEPFGPRLAESCTDTDSLRRRYRRALQFAATHGNGWIMPMGVEFASPRRLDPVRDQPADFDNLARAPVRDCATDIKSANALCQSMPPAEAGLEGRFISAPNAGIAAILRPSRADSSSTRLILANTDINHARRIDASSLLVRSGGHGARFRCLMSQEDSIVSGDTTVELAPGEVRILALEPRPSASPKRRPAAVPPGRAVNAPRIGIEAITPSVDGGRFAAKRLVGDKVSVEADIICDGHGILAAAIFWRHVEETVWQERRMTLQVNDRWTASFPLERIGRHVFTVEAWCDAFGTFRDELGKKYGAGRDVTLEIEEGRLLIAAAAQRMTGSETATALERIAAGLGTQALAEQVALLLAETTAQLMATADDRPFAFRHEPAIPIEVDRLGAAFSSWYEIFPRSQSDDVTRHGTFDDVIGKLPRVRAMGFDVLYFPPIHPIGRINRKGRNNSLQPAPDDPGSPYAIGAAEGGHDAIHPELGTFDDFRRLREAAAEHGLELALDFAIQCAPDHPWLKQHPEWFDWRPDGSLRYAENPPKKYEDIVNVDFYAEGARPSLWVALRDTVLFWAGQGVRLFRVDNPHTKPLPFWEWLIADVRSRHPDALFLSEAFTRPKMMYRLAKLGFSQSYTYFTWRNTKHEIAEYLTELATTAPRDFFRPHFFVNTPDINPIFLQTSGRPGFLIRAALAATLSGLWGVYNGFELCEGTPVPGREEYADSEKYQLRAWNWDRPGNIVGEITRLNEIRRRNPALQSHLGVAFHNAFNDNILYFAKATPSGDNTILVAISLDPHNVQEADFEVPLWTWGLPDHAAVVAEDLMRGGRAVWTGKVQHLRLDPHDLPFGIWRVAPIGSA